MSFIIFLCQRNSQLVLLRQKYIRTYINGPFFRVYTVSKGPGKSAQADQGLSFLLTESFNIENCIIGGSVGCRSGDQEIAGLTSTGSASFFHGDLIMKYFLRSFSPFSRFKKGSCKFLVKECA